MADKEESFTPTSLDDLVNRSGRPRDEQGRFVSQPRDEGDPSHAESIALETQQTAPEGDGQAGEAQGEGDGVQTSVPAPAKADKPDKPGPQIPLAAAQDDRAKRQAATDELATAQARIKELEAKVAAPPASIATAQPQQPSKALTPAQKAARASVFDDENAFAEAVKAETRAEIRQEEFGNRIADGEERMREKHEDFEEVMGMQMVTVQGQNGATEQQPRMTAWLELKERRPDLDRGFHEARNPVRFAYEAVKKDREARQLSDPAHQQKLIDDRVALAVAAELAKNGVTPAAPAAPAAAAPAVVVQPAKVQPSSVPKPAPVAPPASIATQTSSNLSRAAPAFQGPTSLDALINQVGKPSNAPV